MMNNYRILVIGFALFLLGCGHTTFRSAVPNYPVNLRINTNVGEYVHFVPENVGTYLIADPGGIHLNGITQPLTVQDAYGFAGTVVYIDGVNPYGAYELCCPRCLDPLHPCEVDGMFAVCPLCGEQYDIYLGGGVPKNGIATEPLKRHLTSYNPATGILTVTRMQ